MIKKIRVQDMEVGMFVTDFNTPWIFHPFVPNKKKIENPRELVTLVEYGIDVVHIDSLRGKDSPKAIPVDEADRELRRQLRDDLLEGAGTGTEEIPEPVPFAAEFRKARAVYAEAKVAVKHHFDDVRSGRRVDGESAELTVSDMVASIFRNRDALLSLARLKSFDEYTFHHSLNVAVLALNVAVSLGILDAELHRLGIGAVLHDLGKVRLPDGLIQKQGPLDSHEYEVVKSHAAHGAKIILEARSVPLDCANVPLSHHERYDGKGYPRRLGGIKVGKFGLITAIADVYDAMTTDRPYQKGMPPTLALKKIYGWAGTHFHPLYVRKFIQCLGIFPIGTVVRLDTGEIGVVVKQNRDNLLRPRVRLTHDVHSSPLSVARDVDLRTPDPLEERPFSRSVQTVLDPREIDCDVDTILATEATVREERLAVAG